MANEIGMKNLRPFNTLSKEEARKIQSAGGKARAEALKKRKTLKEELLAMLEDPDVQKSVTLALVKQAQEGNVKAYETIQSTIGEKPKEVIVNENVDMTIDEYVKKVQDEAEY